jgi:chemotaxis protein MotB
MPVKKVKVEEVSSADEVPAYIVTFSDMVTLLLTFFVMLLSLADVQDPELLNKGRDSFVESLQYCGMGMFFNNKVAPGLGSVKTKYQVEEAEPNALRTIDENRERLRRIFSNVQKSMSSMPSQIVAQETQFITVPVNFGPEQSSLNPSSQQALARFASRLKQNATADTATLYVLGLADKNGTEREKWLLSARRAQTAAQFLKTQLSKSDEWHVFSWGAGSGGTWTGRDGIATSKSQVLIAILRTDSHYL